MTGACALTYVSDRDMAVFGCVCLSCLCPPHLVFRKWALSARCAPGELSSDSLLFYIRMPRKYTVSYLCHIFSKMVFIKKMSLRKVGHSGDPPDGVSCESPMSSDVQ